MESKNKFFLIVVRSYKWEVKKKRVSNVISRNKKYFFKSFFVSKTEQPLFCPGIWLDKCFSPAEKK